MHYIVVFADIYYAAKISAYSNMVWAMYWVMVFLHCSNIYHRYLQNSCVTEIEIMKMIDDAPN